MARRASEPPVPAVSAAGAVAAALPPNRDVSQQSTGSFRMLRRVMLFVELLPEWFMILHLATGRSLLCVGWNNFGFQQIHQAVHQKLMSLLDARRIRVPYQQRQRGQRQCGSAIPAEEGN